MFIILVGFIPLPLFTSTASNGILFIDNKWNENALLRRIFCNVHSTVTGPNMLLHIASPCNPSRHNYNILFIRIWICINSSVYPFAAEMYAYYFRKRHLRVIYTNNGCQISTTATTKFETLEKCNIAHFKYGMDAISKIHKLPLPNRIWQCYMYIYLSYEPSDT